MLCLVYDTGKARRYYNWLCNNHENLTKDISYVVNRALDAKNDISVENLFYYYVLYFNRLTQSTKIYNVAINRGLFLQS